MAAKPEATESDRSAPPGAHRTGTCISAATTATLAPTAATAALTKALLHAAHLFFQIGGLIFFLAGIGLAGSSGRWGGGGQEALH